MKKIAFIISIGFIVTLAGASFPFVALAQDKNDDIFNAIKKELTRDKDFYSPDSIKQKAQQIETSDSLTAAQLKALKKAEKAKRKAEKTKARAEAKAARFAEQQRLLEERQRTGAQQIAEKKALQQSEKKAEKSDIKNTNSGTIASPAKKKNLTEKPLKDREKKLTNKNKNAADITSSPKNMDKTDKPPKIKKDKLKKEIQAKEEKPLVETPTKQPTGNIPLTETDKKLAEKKAFIDALQKRNAEKAAKRQAAFDKATGTIKQPSKKEKSKKNTNTLANQEKTKAEKKPKLKDTLKDSKFKFSKKDNSKEKTAKPAKQKNTGSITIPKKKKTKTEKGKKRQSIIDKIVNTSTSTPEPLLDENGVPVKITVDDRLENPDLSVEQRQRLLLKKQNQEAREIAKAERKEAAASRRKLRKEMRAVQAKVDSVNRIKFSKEKENRLKKRLATMTPDEMQRYNQRQKNKVLKARVDSVKRANRQVARNYLNNRRNSITYYDKEGKLNPVIDTVLVIADGYAALNEQDKQKYKFNFNRGLMKVTLEDHREALKYFQKCLDLTPYNEEVLQLRGNTFVELNKFKQAKRDFEFALTKKSGDPVLYYNYAITNAKLGNFQDAIVAFDQAIDLQPDYMLAYQGRAVAKTMTGDFDGSLEDYDRAIEQNAYFTSAYKGRGVSKCLMGEYQDAIYDFTMVLEFKPDDALSYYYRGLAYHGLDNFFKGCTDLSRADDMGIFAAGMQLKSLCK